MNPCSSITHIITMAHSGSWFLPITYLFKKSVELDESAKKLIDHETVFSCLQSIIHGTIYQRLTYIELTLLKKSPF